MAAACRGCGRPIRWENTPAGERVALDTAESVSGEDRFMELDGGRFMRIGAHARVPAYPLHECPKANPA